MDFTRFFKALLAFALVLASSLIAPHAMAAAPVEDSHEMAEAQSAHCASMPADGPLRPADHPMGGNISCCTATCLGTAVVPVLPVQHVRIAAELPRLTATTRIRGVLAEIATPPPRTA